MKVDNTYKKIVDKFLSIESKYNLLQSKINGLYFWQISRVNIYLTILDSIIPGSNEDAKKNNVNFRILLQRLIFNSLLFNPFFSFTRKDYLIFESARKYKYEDKYTDLYTSFFCEDLKLKGVSFKKYETNYEYSLPLHKRPLSIKHLDFITTSSVILGRFIFIRFNKKECELIKKIEYEINTYFGTAFNLLDIIKKDLRIFKISYPFYRLLFKIQRPKEIFIVNSCDKAFIIAAAKKQGIIVNELQHGLISDNDIINNYPNVVPNSLRYFPNRFFVWENIDMCFAALPLSDDNVKKIKNYHIEYWLKKTEHIDKEKNTILVISQPYSSISIMNYIEMNISHLANYKIIYKIHPAESQLSLDIFRDKILKTYDNILFVKNEESIYNLLKKAEYVVGIFSSALYEAAVFKCKILLLNLPGVEMSLPLLKKGNAELINISDELNSILH